MIPPARSLAVRVLAIIDAVVLVSGLTLAAAEGVAGPPPRPAVATMALDGSARVTGPEGRRMLSDGADQLRAGDVIDLLSGEAVLSMVDGGSIEMRTGRGRSTRLALTEVPTLLAGDALVVAPAGAPVAIVAGGARFRLTDGAGRVSRSTGATFAVYQGAATLSSGGRELAGGLPALRQVVVPVPGKLPLTASPISFGTGSHVWDRRFLGDVIDLQAALERRSVGFTTSLRQDIRADLTFFQAILPKLVDEPAFDQALLGEHKRPVGETLVGAAVALVAEGGGFGDRWREVFRLREAGAGWGVVAVDVGADRGELMSSLDEAVNRSPLLFGAPPPDRVFEPRLPTGPTRPGAAPPPKPAAPLVRPAPAAPPPPPPAPPVVLPAPPTEPESVMEPVVDPLVNLLDGVLDGLDDLTGGLL